MHSMLFLSLFCSAFAGAALSAEHAPARGPLVLRLEFAAEPGHARVRLAQVAEVVSDPEEVWSVVRDLIVAQPNDRCVTRGKIERRLAGAGLPAGSCRVTGPAVCDLAGGGGQGR